MNEPWDVADRFVAAVAAGEEVEAAACCSADAWIAETDSPSRIFRQSTDGGLVVAAAEVERTDDRAVATLEIAPTGKPDRARTVCLLLENTEVGWQIDGVSLGELHVNAFLAGYVDARPRFEKVDGYRILHETDPTGSVGRRLRLRLDQLTESGGTWTVTAAGVLRGLDRAQICIRSLSPAGDPSDAWLVVDLERRRVIAEESFASWGSLFAPDRTDAVAEDDELEPPPA